MGGTAAELSVAKGIIPPMRLEDVLRLTHARSVDIAVFVRSCEEPRQETAKGVNITVANAKCTDEDNEAEIAGWGSLATHLRNASGSAVTLTGVSAYLSDGGVKLSLRENQSAVCAKATARVKVLASMSNDTNVPRRVVTAVFAGSIRQIDVSGLATHSCAAFLNVLKSSNQVQGVSGEGSVYQANNVHLEASLETILTKDGVHRGRYA